MDKHKVLNQDAIKYIAMVAAFTVVFLYNGKRSQQHKEINKWIFYCFYPIHFLILTIFT